jgi:hypothetical protein
MAEWDINITAYECSYRGYSSPSMKDPGTLCLPYIGKIKIEERGTH